MELITGYAGTSHIYSDDDREFNEGLFGNGTFALPVGNKLKAELVTNNRMNILDGSIIIQGAHVRIRVNDTDEVTINNGTQGELRKDLVVVRYEKTADEGKEKAYLKVVKGTPSASNPEDPEVTTGNIRAGDLVHEEPLYRVNLNGISVESVDQLFEVIPTIPDLLEKYNELNSSIQDSINKIAVLNDKIGSVGSAMKFKSIPSGENLTYGCWDPGIYPYGGYSEGAPSDYAGVMLVFFDGKRNYIKIAFTGSADIYVMTQDSTGNILTGWRAWSHS